MGGGVFRRRRITVAASFLVLLAVILTVWTRVSGAGVPADAMASSPAPASGVSSSASSAGTPVASSAASDSSGVAVCASSDLSVVAVTDKTTYAAGEKPVLTIRLSNMGSSPCVVNVGSSQLALVITSGSSTIWRSADCAKGSADTDKFWNYDKVIQPAQSLESVGVTWDRVFSNPTACDASVAAVDGGGAAYWLSASVGDVSTTDANRKQFFLQ